MRTIVFLTAAALAAPALASPPPLPVAVTPVVTPDASDGLLDDGFALRTALIGQQWFSDTPSTLSAEDLRACGLETDPEPCIRALTAPTRGASAPEVVVVLTPEAGKVRLRCYGPGTDTRSVERQSVLIDLAAALATDPTRSREDRNAAAGCMISAAAESGW